MCILTDSTPRMACTCPAPSTSAPAMPAARPRRARGEERGRDTARRPRHAPAPRKWAETASTPPRLHLHRPARRRTPAARMICTTGHRLHLHHDRHSQPQELHRPAVHAPRIPATRPPPAPAPDGRGKGRGKRARREEQGKTARRRAVKVIYTEPMPTSTCPAPENSQPLPVLLPAQLLRPLSCNSAFGEFAEPRPPEAPIADGEHLPARLLSIQAPGEPLHFQRPGQFYKLTQYLPSLTYPSFFTRQ